MVDQHYNRPTRIRATSPRQEAERTVGENSCQNPLAAVAESIHTGEATSTEIVETVLSRIETVAPQLNCYLTVLADEATRWA
jgi:hypothetical protein